MTVSPRASPQEPSILNAMMIIMRALYRTLATGTARILSNLFLITAKPLPPAHTSPRSLTRMQDRLGCPGQKASLPTEQRWPPLCARPRAQRGLIRKEDPAVTAHQGGGTSQPYTPTMVQGRLGQSLWDLGSGLWSPVSGSVLDGT